MKADRKTIIIMLLRGMYDYFVVGSGLYGTIFAHKARQHDKSVRVIDKSPDIAGYVYIKKEKRINFYKWRGDLLC